MLLFGIATSVDLFQSKLSRSAIQCLDGQQFNVEHVEIERLFAASHTEPPTRQIISGIDGNTIERLWLGPLLSRLIIDQQKICIQSSSNFISALEVGAPCNLLTQELIPSKYAYMSHFFSNPLSSALAAQNSIQKWQMEHLEAVRNLSSFRRLVNHRYEDYHVTEPPQVL